MVNFQIKLFGQDLISLQEHIDNEYLPPELGGTCEDVTTDKWIKLIETDYISKGVYLQLFISIDYLQNER